MKESTNSNIRLRLTALGGLDEIGNNMWLYEASSQEYSEENRNSEYIIVDAGNIYPGYDSPGVDYMVPDSKILEKEKTKIKALILTSVHESHSGGAHHIIKKFNISKVIGSKLAIEQVKARIDKADNIEWQYFESRRSLEVGKFKLTAFHITSSSLESYALSIQAGSNTVFYSGSYKIDQTRLDDPKTDISAILAFSSSCLPADSQEAGLVDLYLGASAGVENEGYSPSELDLYYRFKSIFKTETSRIIVNTYSSNSVRIVYLLRAALECSYKVAFHGQEIKEAYNAIVKAGLSEDYTNIISIKDIDQYPDSKLLILSSAPEGLALREIESMAYAKSLELELKAGDLLINSADPAPGTLRIMAQISDQLFLKGVRIQGGRNAGLHSPSHAFTEEMKFMFNLMRPRYFSPVIGESRQLARHAKLAIDTGFDPSSILMISNGDVLELYNSRLQIVGQIEIGEILVNHKQDFHLDDKIIKEREAIALEGVVTISFSINKKKRLVAGPVFTARACTFSRNKEWKAFCLLNTPEIIRSLDNLSTENPKANIEDYQRVVREYMNKVIKQQIGKKPAVIVFANEV